MAGKKLRLLLSEHSRYSQPRRARKSPSRNGAETGIPGTPGFRVLGWGGPCAWTASPHTATVNVSSVRITDRYSVSRSTGTRPAVVISRISSSRRMPCGVVAPASW